MKRAGVGVERSTIGAVVLVSLMLMPLASYGEDKYWVGGSSGWWDDIGNWSPSGQPQTGDNTYLTQSDAVDRTVDYRNVLDPAPSLANLTVDATGSGTITLFQASHWLSAGHETIGSSGVGALAQTGGTNTVAGSLTVGSSPGSAGMYALSGTGILSALSEEIGRFGPGDFTQSGGTNAIAGQLFIGSDSGGMGTYNLSGTGSLSALNEQIGGSGTFNQSGGTNTVAGELPTPDTMAGQLSVGSGTGGTGTYNLSGTGVLSALRERIGGSGGGIFTQTGGTNTTTGSSGLFVADNGTGTYTQTGGTNTVTSSLWVGTRVGTSGLYDLSGTGALSAGSANIGIWGQGTFTQTGGTNTIAEWLSVGQNAGSNGSYNLGGTGVLSVGKSETIGRYGTGTFTQTGGTNTIAGNLNLGERSGGAGTYNQSAGTTTLTGTTSILNVGHVAGATGTYNLSGTGAVSVSVSTGIEIVGDVGTGLFTQTGGTNETDTLIVGNWYGGAGTYRLSGGDLRVTTWEGVGNNSMGTFEQTGGTNTIAGRLTVGNHVAGPGTYDLSGTGALSADIEDVGNRGAGTFTQTGGTNTTGTLTIKVYPTGSGVYNLNGGTLNAMTIVNNDRLNYSGGTLNGNFTNTVGATFTLSGAGERTVNGDVMNWGTIKVTGATEGTTVHWAGDLVNNGVLDTDPARLEFLGDLIIGPDGSIYASPGDQYVFHQDLFIDNSSAADLITADADLIFAGSGTHLVSLNSLDLVAHELSLEGGAVLEFDGSGSLYAPIVSGLVFDSGRTIANILAPSTVTLFYDPILNPDLTGIYQFSGGGTFSPVDVVPLPAGVWLGVLGLIVAGRRLWASGR